MRIGRFYDSILSANPLYVKIIDGMRRPYNIHIRTSVSADLAAAAGPPAADDHPRIQLERRQEVWVHLASIKGLPYHENRQTGTRQQFRTVEAMSAVTSMQMPERV